jgi:aminoglycoside phosphotransferase family enzyme
MHYLPRERMLDARAQAGPVQRAELEALLEKLAAFYATTTRATWDGSEYRQHLERQIRTNTADLLAHESLPDRATVKQVASSQLAFLRDAQRMLEDRLRRGRVVDAHGDLRPEHILLGEAPQIIDCLEFSAELRMLDTAEEIAFLALECTVLGRSDVAREIVALYRKISKDAVPRPLLDFYYCRRAMVRALLSLWHLDEPLPEPLRTIWLRRARWYLDAAHSAAAGASVE